MSSKRRSSLAVGLILILVGLFFLAAQFLPELNIWTVWFDWPVYAIGVGFLLLLIGLLVGEPDMAVPACIVGGIGGILYWQNATGNWESWSYVWALIPGFAGVGRVISGLLGPAHKRWKTVQDGLQTVLVSAALFVVFGSFFGLSLLGDYWPVLLIALGVLLMARALFRGTR
jgi:hypothetical protein